MKIATVCVFNPMLSLYLEAVKQCFEHWGRVIAVQADFSEVSEEAARNEGLSQVEDCDFVWVIDSDEFLLKHDQEWILRNAINYDRKITMVRTIDYMSMNEVMEPQRGHTPIVLMKPSARFYDGRCANGEKLCVNANVHNFGMVYPPEVLKWKADHYWNKSDPGQFTERLKSGKRRVELPEEIRALLEKYSFKEKGNDGRECNDNNDVKKTQRANGRKRTLVKSGSPR